MSPTHYPKLNGWTVALRLVGGGLGLALVLCIVGWSIVSLAPRRWKDTEGRVNNWFVDQRTSLLDTLTHIGSYLSETITCIAVLIIAFIVLRLWLGRWRESWAVAAALVGELQVFLIVTALVGRDRPNVDQLDLAPPTSSFPSGHTAAAVALYGCIAIIVLRELSPRWIAVTIAAVCWTVPLIVGVSRVYRGMHFPSDVIFGALGGAAWLTIVVTTILPLSRRSNGDDAEPADAGDSAGGELQRSAGGTS